MALSLLTKTKNSNKQARKQVLVFLINNKIQFLSKKNFSQKSLHTTIEKQRARAKHLL